MAGKKIKKSDLQKKQALENQWAFELAHRLMEADAVERQARKEPNYDRMDYAYWDWDKRAFRAFRADKVVRICAVSIPNYDR